MRYTSAFISTFISILLLASCKINQRSHGEKVGKWIYKDKIQDEVLISKGRYKNDFEKGIWKEYLNGSLVCKKKYKNGICYTTEYHLNGKIKAFGISKMEVEDENLHWFLSDEWKFYDEKGHYLGSRFYEFGAPIATTLDTIN